MILDSYDHPHPVYWIEVDGVDITSSINGRLIDLNLTDNRGFEADQLQIRLDDSDGMLDLPARGAKVSIAFGWPSSGMVPKGTYTIDEVEHSGTPDVISIHARSADLRSGLTTQRERSWHKVTLGAIVRTIANENDIEPVISASLAGQMIDHIDQTNESAVNLLTRLAQQFDAIATVKNNKLIFMPAAGGLSASGQALPAISIVRASGDRHTFRIAERDSYAGVKALYHDLDKAIKGEVIWGKDQNAAENNETQKPAESAPAGQYKSLAKTYRTRAAAKRAARKAYQGIKANKSMRSTYVGVKARYNDLNVGDTGEVIYSAKDQAAKAAETAEPTISASADNVKTLRHVYANKTNALRAARAEWRKIQRGVASFSIVLALGRPEIFPDLPAIVSGFKPAIDNTGWIVTKATHSLDDNGIGTALEFEIKATEAHSESNS